MSQYKTSQDSIDQLATSLDLSHSSETFTLLPVEQDTKPATAASEPEGDDLDSEDSKTDNGDETGEVDDEYEKGLEQLNIISQEMTKPNNDFTLPDGTHLHNNADGTVTYNDDGTEFDRRMILMH